jgi:hypothetical protein
MTDTPYASSMTAIKAMWDSRWDGSYPSIWQENNRDILPNVSETPIWLHLTLDYTREDTISFGSPGNHERELTGTILINVFAKRGIGDVEQLSALDKALSVFRGQRVGSLTIAGSTPLSIPGNDETGQWSIRSGFSGFVWRFRA